MSRRTQLTPRQAAIQAAVAALRDPATPEIWRSWEALAEAVIDAATPHLVDMAEVEQEDLFA